MDELPLAGWTVAVTAARRREEQVGLLERRGARVVQAPALRTVPVEDDEELRAATRSCLEITPDVVVVTTAVGFRGWLAAADAWGLGEDLRSRLAVGEIVVRGPKATGAVRAAGLSEAWSPASESTEEVLARLLAEGVRGRRVVVQQHGEPLTSFVEALRAAGAQVLEVPVYRWVPPEDVGPLSRLVDQVVDGEVDAVTFTSAPAAVSLLAAARERGRADDLVAALRDSVLAACVGPVTAEPLERAGVPTVQPARARLAALVRTVVEELPRRGRTVRAGAHVLRLRGTRVAVDGRPVALPGRQGEVLAALAEADGQVLSSDQLGQRVWPDDGADEHAVEVAVTGLRAALGPAGTAVQSVGSGYRLAASED